MMRKRSLKAASMAIAVMAGASAIGWTTAGTALAQENATTELNQITDISGHYAGTFICGFGEMGMTLSLNTAGPASPEKLAGVLNFFPTAGNPDAPSGAFKVTGSAAAGIRGITKIDLQPGEWIDQPAGFGSSPMTATVRNGTMVGKPTAPGCYTLRLRKLSGV